MAKPIRILIGFIFFIMGILSIILTLCGMQFIFLAFINRLAGIWSLLIYAIMCLGGLMIVMANLSYTKIPKEYQNDH